MDSYSVGTQVDGLGKQHFGHLVIKTQCHLKG